MYFHDLKAKNKTDCHHQILSAAAAPLILFMISVNWIQSKDNIQYKQCRHYEYGQVSQLVLLGIKVVEKGVTHKYGIREHDAHVEYLYPPIELLFESV